MNERRALRREIGRIAVDYDVGWKEDHDGTEEDEQEEETEGEGEDADVDGEEKKKGIMHG